MNDFTLADRLKWLAVTVAVAAAAVPLSFVLWRTPPGAASPPPNMLPLLMPVEVVMPALALGLGTAFMLFGRRLFRTHRSSAFSRASFASIWWLLVSWWPHSNFHRVSSGWASLAAIDYVFHTSVIVATCVVAAYFVATMQERRYTGTVDAGVRQLRSAGAVKEGS